MKTLKQRIEDLKASGLGATTARRCPARPSPALWYDLFQAGFNEVDLQRVIRYLQREIREGRRNVGALKLSNLLQIDRFEEDLNISRVQLYAPKPIKPVPPPSAPPPTPEEKEAARQRALQLLAKLRAEHGL